MRFAFCARTGQEGRAGGAPLTKHPPEANQDEHNHVCSRTFGQTDEGGRCAGGGSEAGGARTAVSPDATAGAGGTTPLMPAAVMGRGDMARLPPDHGADANATNGGGRTALLPAVPGGARPWPGC